MPKYPKGPEFTAKDNPHRSLELEELASVVKQSLLKMDDVCRQVLTWFYLEGRSQREIASLLGKSENWVKAKRYTCMKTLREHFLNLYDADTRPV